MAWLISGVLSSVLLGGMLAMIAALVAGRWTLVSAALADGSTVSLRDRDQLVLPLRFAT